MSAITLGTVPDSLTVVLAKGADFNATLRNINNATDRVPVPWDPGTVIELRFGSGVSPTVWAATVAGADAVFSVDKAVVAPVYSSNTKVVRLYYINGTTDVMWADGEIERQ